MVNNGIEWTEELEKELCTPEEIEENNLQARLMCEIVDAQQERGNEIHTEDEYTEGYLYR